MVVATPWAHSRTVNAWDTQSGYFAGAKELDFYGMAHSALSGAGSGELGELRLLPLSVAHEEDADHVRSVLRTESVRGSPGYFTGKVGTEAQPNSVQIRSSATPRGAIHEFTFEAAGRRFVRLLLSEAPDAFWGYKLYDHSLSAVSDRRLEGCSFSTVSGIGSAESLLCFVVEFDAPFDAAMHEPLPPGVLLRFRQDSSSSRSAALVARVAVSRTDLEHARGSFDRELKGKSLQAVVASAERLWDQALGVARIEIEPEARRRVFYSALYHSMLAPSLLSEENGAYRLQGGRNRTRGEEVLLRRISEKMPLRQMPVGHHMYSTFSSWDTYRSLHTLMNLVHPDRSADFALSIINLVDAWGLSPPLQIIQSPTDMMEGDGGSIILGTMARAGLVDAAAAFRAMNESRRARRAAVGEHGYIDRKVEHCVSKALEEARADSCTSRVAEDLGLRSEAAYFKRRAELAFDYWDPQQAVFAPIRSEAHGRLQHDQLKSAFDVERPYAEGSALQYSWGAEFDVEHMVAQRGGPASFVDALDYFFDDAPEAHGDGDNVIGNRHGLSLGNEPTHHTPYLYSLVGCPAKSQALLDDLVKGFFRDEPDGLPGNDDMGATSAWVVLSMLGLYPVDACSGELVLGRPFVKRAELSVRGGTLRIRAHGQGEASRYVRRATWREKEVDLRKPVFSFGDLASGGELVLWMTAEAPACACRYTCSPRTA